MPAQSDFWGDLRDSLVRHLTGTEIGIMVVLLAIGLALLSWVFSRTVWPRWREARKRTRLYRALCRMTRVTGPERRVLARAAKLARLPDPALIFVKRSAFEHVLPILQLDKQLADSLIRKLYSE